MTKRTCPIKTRTLTTEQLLKRLLADFDHAYAKEADAEADRLSTENSLKRFLAANGFCSCLEIRFDKLSTLMKL